MIKMNKKRILGLLLGLLSLIACSGIAANSASANSVDLEKALARTQRQHVSKLDKSGLQLVLNERMDSVTIEGWSTQPLTTAQKDALFNKFGVRADWTINQGDDYYLAPDNVGRAGILDGPVFMKLNGKVYRGLTLKGYGANKGNSMGEQPAGSLAFDESIRDMEVSTILVENNVSTYVGVLSVQRPNNKANFVRLSRTALRMEDFMRVQGADLTKLVDYMTDLMTEEMGKKLTFAEFNEWLVRETGDLMARKDHIRFKHASITNSNLGIGEMVDLGDFGGGMILPEDYKPQNAGQFKSVCQRVHENMVKADPSLGSVPFDQWFDESYGSRLKELRALDASRINLNRAQEADLKKIGFTAEEALEVVKFNASIADGVIDPMEIASIKTMTRDVKAILEKATTDFMTLSDGSQLASYYVRGIGGTEGVRALMEEARTILKNKGISLSRDASGKITGNVAQVSAELERLALERAKKLGFEKVLVADRVTNFSRFIAKQALEVIVKK